MIVAETKIKQDPQQATSTQTQLADVWRVVVLNDPVNLMSYVVMVFKRVFGFEEWSGVREQAEAYVFTLQQWHLTAVIESDEAS
jgi:ATP-dependent Clp protease adaptor protein ClpS